MSYKYKSYVILSILLLFVLLSRGIIFENIYVATPEAVVRPDTVRYEAPSIQLLEKGTLAIAPKELGTPTLSTTPLYSLFIAGIYKAFGINHYYLIMAQLLLSTISTFIIYLTARAIWSQKTALIAATLMALEPIQILYSQLILSESLFVFFMSLSLFFAVKLLSLQNKYRWAFLLGLVLTAATMTRPISYYLVFAIVLGVSIYKQRLNFSWVQLLKVIALILIPLLVVTSAWKIRNGNLTGVYELNNAKSKTMLDWKAKGVLMLQDSLSDEEAQQIIRDRLPKSIKTVKQESDAEKALAIEIILNNFDSYLKLSAKGIVSILIGQGLVSQAEYYDYKEKGIASSPDGSNSYKLWYLLLIAYTTLFTLTTYILASYGYFQAIKHGSRTNKVIHLLMLGITFYFVIISTGHIAANSRMRVPITPIFLLYASYGIYQISQLAKKRRIEKSTNYE